MKRFALANVLALSLLCTALVGASSVAPGLAANAAGVVGVSQENSGASGKPATARGGDRPVLFLGNQSLPPMNFMAHGKPRGIVVDLAEALAARLPYPVEIRLMDWNQAQQLVLTGQADALLQINPSPERLALYDFSQPLLTSEFTIFTSAGRQGVASMRDLRGLKVGVENGGLPMLLLREDPQILVEVIPDFVQGFGMLTAGALDAVVVDRWVGSYVLAEYDIRHVTMIAEPISRSQSAIAVKKGNLALLTDIDAALADIRRDGTYDRILEQWRPKEVVFKTREQLRQQAWLWLVAASTLALLVALVGIAAQAREIRRRKRSEEALRDSQAMLNMVLDTVPQSIFWKDRLGRYLGCNLVFASAAGLDDSGQIIGKTDFDLPWPREETEAYRADDREVLEHNRPKRHIIERLQQADGTRLWVDTTKIPLTDAKGAPFAVLGVYEDITDRKRAEEALKEHVHFLESLDRLERAIRLAPDMEQMMRDALDVVLEVMGADRAWLLYPCDLEAESWSVPMMRTRPEYSQSVTPDQKVPLAPEAVITFRACLDSDDPVHFGPGGDMPLHPAIREQYAVLSQLSLALYPKIDRPWLFGVHQCARVRHWTEMEKKLFKAMGGSLQEALNSLLFLRGLRESEARYRSIFDNVTEGIFRTGLDGALLMANPALARMYGYDTPEQLIKAMPDVGTMYADRRDRSRFIELLRKHGRVENFEVRFDLGEGRIIWHSTNAYLVRDAAGRERCIEGVTQNITERKLAERRMEASLREKEVLLREIHHRVKNNLQIISSLLSLQEQAVDNPAALDVLSECRGRVASMALIHKQLYHAKELSVVDAGDYLRELLSKLVLAFRGNRTIDLRIDVPAISLDLNQAIPFGLIVNELVTNSLKHAFGGRDRGMVRVAASLADGKASFMIEDDGKGLPANFSLKTVPSLGLQIVITLTSQLHGAFSVEPGAGTRFRLEFPLPHAHAAGNTPPQTQE